MILDTVIPVGRDKEPNEARQNLTRFDRQQLDHELMICIIGETTEEGEWTEHGTVDDVNHLLKAGAANLFLERSGGSALHEARICLLKGLKVERIFSEHMDESYS